MQEPPAPPLHQRLPLVKTVLVAPLINPHPMTTRAKRGFQLPAERLTQSASSTSTLLLMPSSVRAALVDPNWCRVMDEDVAQGDG
jgi:hypothetical protein